MLFLEYQGSDKLKKVEFILPLEVNSKLSLNSIYGGLHWGIRKKQSQNVHELVRLSLLSQKIPKVPFKTPVNIVFKWHSKLDLDNHGYIAKLIIDGLKGYLLIDDTQKYINRVTHEHWQGKGIKIQIQEGDNGG